MDLEGVNVLLTGNVGRTLIAGKGSDVVQRVVAPVLLAYRTLVISTFQNECQQCTFDRSMYRLRITSKTASRDGSNGGASLRAMTRQLAASWVRSIWSALILADSIY